MQETQVQSLVREDPTCCIATEPMHHSYWACALEPGNCNYWAYMPQLLKPICLRACAVRPEKPPQREACTPQPEGSPCLQQLVKTPCSSKDPAQPRINKIILKRIQSYIRTQSLIKSGCVYKNGILHPKFKSLFSSVQFSSVTQSCPTLWDSSTAGFPVYHQLPKLAQTHVHPVGDAIQPSHSLSSPSPPAVNLSQCQGLFKWVSSSNQEAKVMEFQLQHQPFQWTPRSDLL